MSVLISSKNLLIGNGDVFLAANVGALPTLAAYKSALNGGTLPYVSGNVGGIKGTVSVQLSRELAKLEFGVPQLIVDQTCIREGIHIKCALAELSLANVQQQLGLGSGNYSQQSAGAVLVTGEAHTTTIDGYGNTNLVPIGQQPVLYTTSTPAATANPVVYNPTTTTTTDTGGSDFDSSVATTGNVVSTAGWATGSVISIGSEQILIGTVTSGTEVTGCTRGYNGTTAAAHASGSVVTQLYVNHVDFEISDLLNGVMPLVNGAIGANNSSWNITYYYNQLSTETLTGGGNADVNNNALRFFHPYKDGRVLELTIRSCNPVGTVTLPFEEVAYSTSELEFMGIADFSQAPGQQLYSIVRELWASFPH